MNLRIGIVGSLHGDEPLGSEVIALLHGHPSFPVLIEGNIAAIKHGVRYIETDLNRSFPGQETLEGRRAKEILKELEVCDVVIDIHSTTAVTPAFIIAAEEAPIVKKLIDAIPLHYVVHMREGLDSNGSLIAHKSGVSIEYPAITTPEEVVAHLLAMLDALSTGSKELHEEYESIGVLNGGGVLENFRTVQKGAIIGGKKITQDFTPVLSGERAYKGVVCVMCKKR